MWNIFYERREDRFQDRLIFFLLSLSLCFFLRCLLITNHSKLFTSTFSHSFFFFFFCCFHQRSLNLLHSSFFTQLSPRRRPLSLSFLLHIRKKLKKREKLIHKVRHFSTYFAFFLISTHFSILFLKWCLHLSFSTFVTHQVSPSLQTLKSLKNLYI